MDWRGTVALVAVEPEPAACMANLDTCESDLLGPFSAVMASDVIQQQLRYLAARECQHGWTLGALVDQLVSEGHNLDEVEQVVWESLSLSQLVPIGMKARRIKVKNENKQVVEQSAYELLVRANPDT